MAAIGVCNWLFHTPAIKLTLLARQAKRRRPHQRR
jgi:hypothetical protein